MSPSDQPVDPNRPDDPAAPWWWSADDRGDPSEDPLVAHLAARGLHVVDDPDQSSGTDSPEDPDPGPGHGPSDTGFGDDETGSAHPPGICGVCPICRGHAVLQERHPEVAAHLADAARSLSAALATFADVVESETRPSPPGGSRRESERDRFRRIVLDDEEGEGR